MKLQQAVPVVFKKSGVANGSGSFAATAPARLFGLDAGDWSMIFLGLTLSALLVALV